MGASGAGKTTLLDGLSGRKSMGTTEGILMFDGHARGPAFARYSSYPLLARVAALFLKQQHTSREGECTGYETRAP